MRVFGEMDLRAAGYTALVEKYSLEVIPNWHQSFVAQGNTRRVHHAGDVVREVYPARYWPGDRTGDHLAFALKYDGTNLAILARIFKAAPAEDVTEFVAASPHGKYARRIWYLYELLTARRLPVDDLKTGGYTDLIDPEKYYTRPAGQAIRRQRIRDNLPGDPRFCPMVRKSDVLKAFEAADLSARCREIMSGYPTQLLKRAMTYLYTKETKSSFEIEHIKPGSSRTERFVALLQLAGKEDFCHHDKLLNLQNMIVDPRFRDQGLRTNQNYVGETMGMQGERVHFVSPKPEDLSGLMDGLVAAHQVMDAGTVPAVVHAAVIAYAFVFFHPFEDGNGRIHRFLIHNILARRKYTPDGMIFPVSSSMLKQLPDYDRSLECFSRPLLPLVDYTLDEEGRMTVHNETADWYRFMDMTPQVEALYRFIEVTVEQELAEELDFLACYDEAKKSIQEIVDMPDRKIDLFIRFCSQAGGRMSAGKRKNHFGFLTDEEVSRLEQAYRDAFVDGKTED